MVKFFESPCQVAFYDSYNDTWTAGIGTGDIVICASCGCAVDIDEIYADAPEDIDEPIVKYETWNDLSSAITGTC